jgi:hypothetical protein
VSACVAVIEFLSSPMLGAASDVVGRKPLLMLSLCVHLVQFTLIASWVHPAAVALAFVVKATMSCTPTMVNAMASDARACAHVSVSPCLRVSVSPCVRVSFLCLSCVCDHACLRVSVSVCPSLCVSLPL